MTRIFNTPKYGEVEVRNAMLDVDSHNLEEGIEIKLDNSTLIELYGYRDLEELEVEDLEDLITINL